VKVDVLGADYFASNGALIASVACLGYLRSTDRTLDATYGKGNWWTEWKPDDLTAPDPAEGWEQAKEKAEEAVRQLQALGCNGKH